MTMPHERLRSLRWSYEVLLEISSSTMHGEDDRDRAEQVLASLPTPQELVALLSKKAVLPGSAADAIDTAGAFFRDHRRAGRCTPDCQAQLDFVLRHYPEVGEAQLWAQEAIAGDLCEWLMSEDVCAKR
jgi:hypothetical protein